MRMPKLKSKNISGFHYELLPREFGEMLPKPIVVKLVSTFYQLILLIVEYDVFVIHVRYTSPDF